MKKYKNLQYLRVLACIGVVLTHLGQRLDLATGPLNNFAHFGAMGVYVFFIISGFLGFYTYPDSNAKGNIRTYWFKRLLRIIPVYYAIILYDIILYTFVLKDVPFDATGLGWSRYFLFLSQCIPESSFWRNLSATWTVSVFVLFYLLMPLFKKTIRSLKSSLVALLIFYMIAQMMGATGEWFRPFYYLYFFIIGAVVYYAINECKTNITCVFFAIVMISQLILNKVNATTYSCIFAIIIMVTCELEIKNLKFQKIIDVLDRYSFVIYLVHAIVMDAIDIINDTVGLSQLQIILITFIGTTVVSFVVYHCVEVPTQKIMNKPL